MTTIGIIADTHVPQRLPQLPGGIERVFRGVELILHAGDVNKRYVLDQLNGIAPTLAVAGNADLFRSGLPARRVIEIAGRRIGLIHGHGSWLHYLLHKLTDLPKYNKRRYRHMAYDAFMDNRVDVIVFGHTHRPDITTHRGVLLFNPGSVAPEYYETAGPQIGLLHIASNGIRAELVKL
jgi:putative phosphoesterase